MDQSISTPSRQTHQLLVLFLDYCQKKTILPTSNHLQQFYDQTCTKPKQKIQIKSKIIIKPKNNDYIIFTNNCRNNGFCVQEFKGKPSVFTDYNLCPNSKLVIEISKVNCIVIKYKFYNVISPKTNYKHNSITYETNPIIDQQLEDGDHNSDSEIILDVMHWYFNQTQYLVEMETQHVYLNNDRIGTRIIQNNSYIIKPF